MTDPQSMAEWREAVLAANFFLTFHDCKSYGLLTGGPDVNVDRCVEILKRGKALGIEPFPLSAGTVKQFLAAITP